MADTILKLEDLESFFQSITMKMLGIAEVDANLKPINQDKVRISWPTSGAPAWKITDDVTFIRVNNVSDQITQQRDVGYSAVDSDTANRTVSYTRVHEVAWIFYGPNSFDNADIARNGLYLPQYKDLLKASNLGLILDVPVPVRFPELLNGQWWERTDFTAKFNELVIRQGTVPYIKSADIIIKKG